MIPLSTITKALKQFEPIDVHPVPGPQIQWTIDPRALQGISSFPEHALLNNALVSTDIGKHIFSKTALLEAGALVGIPGSYLLKCPAHLMEDNLNYWYKNYPGTLNVFLMGSNRHVLAIRKSTTIPFPNTDLLQVIQDETEPALGHSGAAPNWTASLNQTYVRLIFPDTATQDASGDAVMLGIQLHNSLTAASPLAITGLLYWPANGTSILSLDGHSGNYKRRQRETPDGAHEWVKAACKDILVILPNEVAMLDTSLRSGISGLSSTLRQIFQTHKASLESREIVLRYLEDITTPSMGDVAKGFAYAGSIMDNDLQAEHAMAIGGSIIHSLSKCSTCDRFMD